MVLWVRRTWAGCQRGLALTTMFAKLSAKLVTCEGRLDPGAIDGCADADEKRCGEDHGKDDTDCKRRVSSQYASRRV